MNTTFQRFFGSWGRLTRILSCGQLGAAVAMAALVTGASAAPVSSVDGAPAPPSESTNHVIGHDYWAVEDAKAREALPLHEYIPAAKRSELTRANGYPKRNTFLSWYRSHGDNSGERYSALDQINRQNVTNLQVAWIYHSRDGAKNLQCNPIVVGEVMFAPTAGNQIVAVNAVTGTEIWRFKPEGEAGRLFAA